MGENIVEKGRLRIQPGPEFSIMDEFIETGDDSGQQHLGIVRWVGKKLEHLQAKIGDERPPGFPYGKDSPVGYAMMKRA
ncbi:hypothetical protein FYK55_01560 [Roseiconus nitratireducens]|uniref:Uncharacterized protein n=2 Tax=Roseiconus nitratireducens TaxID=2605748 RepID=A0A5M6DLR2_9BACT|nr:hypothetical protein FYK55_01560 [Roseiconus nitratireducens]